jgi:phenylalanyl-tRNA synthetase beta chain
VIIEVSFKELSSLLKTEAPLEDVVEALDMMGTPVEDSDGDTLRVEVNPNRIDMLSAEGLARSLNGFLGAETGYPQWKIVPGKLDADVAGSGLRPFISFSTALGAKLTERALKGLMDMQEKLHETVGRDRRKFSIGVYDLSKVRSPITYKELPLNEIEFRPLGESSSMTGKEVLKATDKGKKYAHLVGEKAPVIMDGSDRILSMAPIINADFCRVTPGTTDFLIDSTGTAEGTDAMVAIMATALAERGASLGVVLPGPSYLPRRQEVDFGYLSRVTGLDVTGKTIAPLLGKMRYGFDGDVLVPPYRTDVFGQIDVAEDLAIAHGYGRFGGELPPSRSPGQPLESSELESRVRELFTGFGFLELKTFMLTSPDILSRYGEPALVAENSKSREYSALRQSLLPGMFDVLLANKNAVYPQRVFELGTVFTPGEGRRLAGLVVHNAASFSEIKAIIDRFASVFSLDPTWSSGGHPFFMEGRTAVSDLGAYGEVAPRISSELGVPAAGFELNLERIL